MVLAAECDSVAVPDQMREIAMRIPGAAFKLIPDARHLVCFEHATKVAEVISTDA